MGPVEASEPVPNADHALATWQMSMRLCSPEEAKLWFTALWMETRHETLGDSDLAGKRSLYVRRLKDYPADLVKFVLEDWPTRKGGEWFPSVKELLDALKAETGRRENIGKALKEWGKPAQIAKRIRMIRFDLARADIGHTPKGGDVPDYMRGLQGKALADAMPRYRADMEDRIRKLEALL